jgi:ABC-type antimicrobial peptide transport system permease subunit
VQTALEELFADQGLDLTDAKRLLTELLAVQNTYISTFQSLGGLGLLLGTLGLVAVQLRNVVQRRGELALMRASGFRKNQLTRLVLWEHSLLLLGGLLMGTVAALTAVLPHIFFGGASVPWGTLSLTLGLIAALGLATGLVAIRYVNRAKLLPALRGE